VSEGKVVQYIGDILGWIIVVKSCQDLLPFKEEQNSKDCTEQFLTMLSVCVWYS
jgi:hypothetical protein